MMTSQIKEPSISTIMSIPDGKILDFLTKRFVNDTPEEYVRQNIEKALVRQYKNPIDSCKPEVSIKVGSSNKRVDVVIFEENKPHMQENAYILIETKKAKTNPHGKKDGIEQLKTYMAACLNAKFGLWTNGDERYCIAKREKDGGFLYDEIPEIPSFGQTEAEIYRPERKNLQIATADNLLFAFRRCHNYIAGNAGMHKDDAFWELLKVIFSKIEDERSGTINFYVTPSELKDKTKASATKARIQKLFQSRVVAKYPKIFNSDETKTIELSADVLAYVVSQLQGYSLLASPVDVKGIAYEEIVGSNLRGDRGEFFTPRNACRMAVEMLDPQADQRVIDPACGTGGFLITAMNHALKVLREQEASLWNDPDNPTSYEIEELYRKRAEYLSTCVYGIVAYIAQNIMVKKLWQTKGINLSSNRIILGMAGLGFFILCVFIYGKSLGMSLGSVMGDLGTIGWVIAIITIACFAYVLIRNIRGAGAGTGIVLTVLQTLSGVLILVLGVAKVSLGVAGADMTGTVGNGQKTAEVRSDETARKHGYKNAQDAWANGFDAYAIGDSRRPVSGENKTKVE